MNAAAIYVRLSDDKKRTGENVADQIEAATKIAKDLGYTVVDTYNDNNRSATRGTRPDFERLLVDAQEGAFDAIIIRHVDRLFRTPQDQLRVCNLFGPKGIVIHQEYSGFPVDVSTPSGVLQLGIAAQVALYEVNHKTMRQAEAYRKRTAEGLKPKGGTRPFGFEADGVTHREDEANLIREAYQHVVAKKSIGSLIRRWNGEVPYARIPTTRRKFVDKEAQTDESGQPVMGQWGYASMRDLLMRPANAGLLAVKGKEIGPGDWEPVVEVATYRTVVKSLGDPKRVMNKGDVARKHLLSHIAVCGRCGSFMRAASTKTRAKKVYRLYQCPGTKTRCRMGIDYDVAEAVVIEAVVAEVAMPTSELLAATQHDRAILTEGHARLKDLDSQELEIESSKTSEASKSRRLEAVESERAILNKRLDRIHDAMGVGALLLDLVPFTTVIGGKNVASFKNMAKRREQVRDKFDALDLSQKRAVIRALVSVTVEPSPKGIRPTKETARNRVKAEPLDRTDDHEELLSVGE
jgi:DNA invertase Pin-like site-specific DNA recombinase